jgi:chromatin structure-remodeling complex protein RSC7
MEDEQMLDVPTSEVGTPQDVEEDNGDEEEEEEDGMRESEPPSGPTTPAPEPVVRKRRLGRPPKVKPPGWDDEIQGGNSPNGTPAKRGRGRGGFGRGGGRWARRGGPSHVTQQPVDKEGNMMDVINDEVELPEDPEGEAKVDKMGNLQGGREYRCRTFTVYGRGERLYMLSTEPARCVGFRDSYLFFTKHKRLFKIIIDEDEKRDLIERELIPHSYKGRAIGIVTARSVFREFGAQIIVGGKRIIDDYEVAKAKAEGVIEGELADPNDTIKQGEEYNKNQYVAWHGASSVYHSGAPTVPLQAGKVGDSKKKRIMINDTNWMLEHAREAAYVKRSRLIFGDINLVLVGSMVIWELYAARISVAFTMYTPIHCSIQKLCSRHTRDGSKSTITRLRLRPKPSSPTGTSMSIWRNKFRPCSVPLSPSTPETI